MSDLLFCSALTMVAIDDDEMIADFPWTCRTKCNARLLGRLSAMMGSLAVPVLSVRVLCSLLPGDYHEVGSCTAVIDQAV